MDKDIIEIEGMEINFYKNRTVIHCANGDLYEVLPVMPDGCKMTVEFFHNQVFPHNDRVFGVESMEAMRN
jgi:hypothetical protein